jgi:hypothetical protein
MCLKLNLAFSSLQMEMRVSRADPEWKPGVSSVFPFLSKYLSIFANNQFDAGFEISP